MRNVEVVAYRDHWPADFAAECRNLKGTLADLKPDVQHIGSTSVPGLAAKPIIDILLEVDDVHELDAMNDRFEALGYRVRGENGIPGRRYFEKGGDERTHHVHAFDRGSAGALRHRVFRDYLIAHPQIAHDYASLKREVAESCNNDIKAYCAGKDEFVQQHEKLALEWAVSGRR